MSAEHVLVVAKSDDWHDDDPAWDFAVECCNPDQCNGFIECDKAHDGMDPNEETSPAYDQTENVLIHGEHHDWHYGFGWCVPFNGCVVKGVGNWTDSAWDIASDHGAGRFVVEDEWDDDCSLLFVRPEGVTP